MDMLKNINDAIEYVESNLSNKLDPDKIAEISCTSFDGFQRIFSYLTGITLSEYLRRRRLTEASYMIANERLRVIDLAVMYGYDSADSFSRAFIKQHGITPTQARRNGVTLKTYPPVSFHITVKGIDGMNVKIVEKSAFTVTGIARHFESDAAHRWEQEHIMWADEEDNIRAEVSDCIPGIWFGIWDCGNYMIAKKPEDSCKEGLTEYTIPASSYAVFKTGYGGFVGDELPKLRERVFSEWLPNSVYEATTDYEVEVYHLFPKTEREKRHYELWIPINFKNPNKNATPAV